MAEDIDIENIIEEKFRDIKLETKVIAFALRRHHSLVSSFPKACLTVEPYRIFYDALVENKMEFPKDILYKFVKKVIPADARKLYKTYIIKIYKESLKKLKIKSMEKLVDNLKELHESRVLVGAIGEVVDEMDNFNVTNVKKKLHKAISQTSRLDARYRGEFLEDFEERLEMLRARARDPKLKNGIPTGIREFDELSGGLMPSEIGLVMAATGAGKSVALGNFSLFAWMRGYNVVYYSLEMPKHQVQFRLDSRMTKILHTKFRKAELTKKDVKIWQRKVDKYREERKNYLEVVCLPRGCCAVEVEEEALRIQARRNRPVDLIVIDYINIMNTNDKRGGGRNDWKAQAEIAWDLKALSTEFNGTGVPIWTANQVTDEGQAATRLEARHAKYSRGITEVVPVIVALNQSMDDSLQDIIKMWVVKCRDFEKVKKPIILHPRFNIMALDQEVITLK